MAHTQGSHSGGALAPDPRAFWTLFFTELWERFSYFGNRALLVLFLVSRNGGFALDDRTAAAIYGLFAAATYLTGLPGGWFGDRVFGAQRAILLGGLFILCGNLALATSSSARWFYLGLAVIAVGVGLVKPNVSRLVGALYAGDPQRLDSAFTLYYMGVCVGAALAGIVGPVAAVIWGWRAGYLAAAAGMLLGISVFISTRHWLPKSPPAAKSSAVKHVSLGLSAVILMLLALGSGGYLRLNPIMLAHQMTAAIIGLAVAFFGWVFLFERLDRNERLKITVVMVLCTACALYWSGAELAGSALSLFAERHTDRTIAAITIFGQIIVPRINVPAGAFQSVNPLLIVALAPIFSVMWLRLARRGLNPSAVLKFALGLIFLGLGFFVMADAAHIASRGSRVGASWLLATYLLYTVGELCLSPVGLAAISRLTPARLTGQMMGIWFLSVALGTLVASQLASQLDPVLVGPAAGHYSELGIIAIAAGLGLWALNPAMKKLIGT